MPSQPKILSIAAVDEVRIGQKGAPTSLLAHNRNLAQSQAGLGDAVKASPAQSGKRGLRVDERSSVSELFAVCRVLDALDTIPPLPVIYDPFIQRERNIIGKHAETVDHLAGDRCRLCCMRQHHGRVPSLLDETVHQVFVMGVVYVPV